MTLSTGDEKKRGVSGHDDNILFLQNLDYPKVPGKIEYHPPEPSKELQNQVKKDRYSSSSKQHQSFELKIQMEIRLIMNN